MYKNKTTKTLDSLKNRHLPKAGGFHFLSRTFFIHIFHSFNISTFIGLRDFRALFNIFLLCYITSA